MSSLADPPAPTIARKSLNLLPAAALQFLMTNAFHIHEGKMETAMDLPISSPPLTKPPAKTRHPSKRRGAITCLLNVSWWLHCLRASVPIGARSAASGSGRHPNSMQYRYGPLHDSAPCCREIQGSLLLVLDGQAPNGNTTITGIVVY